MNAPNQQPVAPPIRPWRRLWVRFALILVSLLLVSYFAAPSLEGLGGNLLDRFSPLPAESPPPHVDVTLGGELQAPYVDLLHVPMDESDLVHRLLAWSEEEAPGYWVPPKAVVEQLASELAIYGQAFAWTDAGGRMIAASPELNLVPGEKIPISRPHAESELLRAAAKELDHPNVFEVIMPVVMAGEACGRLHLFTRTRPVEGLMAPGSPEDEPEAGMSPARLARRERLGDWIELTLFLGVALLSSLMLTRMVTRRLSMLASHAATPLEDGDDTPLEAAAGGDEIAVLTLALGDLRNRARTLIGDLTDQDSERRRWIAMISHDLRTPLTALTTCLEGAQGELLQVPSSEQTDEVQRRVSLALTDAIRLRTLTDDLLDIARLDTEKALALEPVPPGELARQTKAIMDGFAEEKKCALLVKVARGLPTIEADGSRLLRALENLVRNALEHATSQVELRVLESPGGIAFEVRDDGPGLPLEDGGRVDFTSLAGLRSRPDSAGLGLTVVRKVAEAHGGQLTARNREETKGALFRLEVPLLD